MDFQIFLKVQDDKDQNLQVPTKLNYQTKASHCNLTLL